MSGKVTFDSDRCKGCELCTTVCPKHIVLIDKSRINRKGYHPAAVQDMTSASPVPAAPASVRTPSSPWKSSEREVDIRGEGTLERQ